MQAQGYNFGLGLMTVLFSVELNSDASSVCILFDKTEGGMVVKSVLVLILLDGSHHWNAV